MLSSEPLIAVPLKIYVRAQLLLLQCGDSFGLAVFSSHILFLHILLPLGNLELCFPFTKCATPIHLIFIQHNFCEHSLRFCFHFPLCFFFVFFRLFSKLNVCLAESYWCLTMHTMLCAKSSVAAFAWRKVVYVRNQRWL